MCDFACSGNSEIVSLMDFRSLGQASRVGLAAEVLGRGPAWPCGAEVVVVFQKVGGEAMAVLCLVCFFGWLR